MKRFLLVLTFCLTCCSNEKTVWQCDYSKASPQLVVVKRISIKMKDGSYIKADCCIDGEWVEAPAYKQL